LLFHNIAHADGNKYEAKYAKKGPGELKHTWVRESNINIDLKQLSTYRTPIYTEEKPRTNDGLSKILTSIASKLISVFAESILKHSNSANENNLL
jgi:hypothetical protein